MGVVRQACGARKRGRVRKVWVYVWMAMVMVVVWCSCSLNLIESTITSTTSSPEHGVEKGNVMDGNDDGKVMIGRVDKEGEGETGIKVKRSDEEPSRTNDDNALEDLLQVYYHGRRHNIQEVFPDNYQENDNKDQNTDAYNDADDDDDDDDDNNNNAIENENREATATKKDEKHEISSGKEVKNIIKKVEGNGREESGKNNSDIKLANYDGEEKNEKIKEGKQIGHQKPPGRTSNETNKNYQNEDEENKLQEGLFVTELKPDSDKPSDSPKIEKKDTQGGKLSWNPPLTYYGHFGVNETLNKRPVVKVVLLAYQRSGSSYTGELLASGGSALYAFEPLYPWRRHLGPAANPVVLRDAARLLGDMLDCRPEVIHLWEKKFYCFRKKPVDAKDFCKDASLRILKTIRARASFLLPWLIQRQDVKVIHLVRDPRGILSSVNRGGKLWSDNNRDIALQCTNIKGDLSLEALGPQRYLRVRYEDLVDRQMDVTSQMFSFLGVPLTHSVEEFLKNHTGQNPNPTPAPFRYLNTYRDLQFHHDHWRNELNMQEVQHIQAVCKDVMSLLQYPFVYPS